jgi:ABC-type antimicrobial peptide transport system permease subunit
MFTLRRLILENLAYHWRGNLAVLIGVAVGSAVLTGALLVGDSLRGSLRARVERQLAGVQFAAMFPRPIRAEVADGLPGKTAPVLLLPGSIEAAGTSESTAPFLGRVSIIGVDDRFRPEGVPEGSIDWNGSGKSIALSTRVAQKLGVGVGDQVKLGVEKFSDLPRSSTFSRRGSADVVSAATFTVAAVLPPTSPGNDFQLFPNPEAPLNVFIPVRSLGRQVFGDTDPRTNMLLAEAGTRDEVNAALREKLQPEDYGLKFREIDQHHYLSIETANLVFSPSMAAAVDTAIKELGRTFEPTIVYIGDTLSHGNKEIAYPVIAALNPAAPRPLGPFLPKDVSTLADGEVVLLQWTGSELNGLPEGSKLDLSYYDPEVEGEGVLRHAPLTLRGYVPLAGAARDRNLIPEVRGVTDARAELRDLDRPPVLPREKILKRVPDEHPRAKFFNTNKATPMVYVNLATGEKLFASRYGAITSIRVAPAHRESLEQLEERLRPLLLKHLDPGSAGLEFEPIRQRLLRASKGGTDFGGLFLGFSLFLIVAALMLVGLLFRLTLETRSREIGLLLASGYSRRHLLQVLLSEGAAIALLGAWIGVGLGILYNHLLIAVLMRLWPDREVANILEPHASALSFSLGFGLTYIMSVGTLWLSIRGLVKVSPPALLRGETAPSAFASNLRREYGWYVLVASLPLGIAAIVAGTSIKNPDFQAMSFFSGGGFLLLAGLAGLWVWMKRTRHAEVNGRGFPALALLGARNAARNSMRSLLTVALLASAAFLLVAVESFRRQPGREFLDKSGGSGGFELIAETDVPLFQSFGSGPGRQELEKHLHDAYAGGKDSSRYQQAISALEGIEVFPLRLRPGDDASCLNLFQAARPRVLGAPRNLVNRGGFKFYASEARNPEEKANPWLLLDKSPGEGFIPVICEQNTAQWMLKKAVGDQLTMPGDDGKEVRLRIVATLADSPFQSELLMSDDSFARAFPKTTGYRVFLIHAPSVSQAAVSRDLATAYRSMGMVVTPTREKVAAYQAVIGAYLSTFQLLGGLGLLLGVLGLAVVILRSVWERLGELALLRAVGYRTRELQFLVLAENALLLALGLAIGIITALASVSPHVAEGASVPWLRLAELLFLVIFVGLGVASAATAGILRVPLIPALRRE